MAGAGFTLTQDAGAGLWALNRLDVGGKVRGSSIRAAGHIKSVTVGAMEDTILFAGVKPAYNVDLDADGVVDLPLAADCFPENAVDALAMIGSVTIRGGDGLAGNLFVNSNVAAGRLGKMYLKDVWQDNGGRQFGLATLTTMDALTWRQGAATYKWNTAAWPADTGDFLGPRPPSWN